MDYPLDDCNICECCVTEFEGGQNTMHWTIEETRQMWIDEGMPWWTDLGPAPDGWNPVEQLKSIGVHIENPLLA